MNNDMAFDRAHIWHPYTSMTHPQPCYEVESASGVELRLKDGRILVDGMSSWWAAVHGYNHPLLNEAIQSQLKKMAHVMFGGITHAPAISLCRELLDLVPSPLECVFLSDSGSVSVEVALKMALQYWRGKGTERKRFLTLARGYHGDTFGAMSVCDPVNSMHSLYQGYLPLNHFAKAPESRFGEAWNENDVESLEKAFKEHGHETAAVILEPIVQGAGGMRIYHPEYLRKVRSLCDQYNVLMIADEVATGFGRTGKMFACEHAGITPDIMCLGKALTGGYMSLAATVSTRKVAEGISNGSAKCFMHGPTFMANPLACSVAHASLKILKQGDWKEQVKNIEKILFEKLSPLKFLPSVKDVRVLGAIGVVEMHEPVDLPTVQEMFVNDGVWIRPFGKLIYVMPPYIIKEEELLKVTHAINIVVSAL
ncbi:adenosylmethionine--8-amino-7-oxononanoate transaminase [Citrobacter europaeus]|uniref:adenosylmethionine--8-amino-7-oxononanoate transaminase n=1 Tax=Citrobacter europaeus TaxID=1914243 RepID=UPI000538942D|nr:adenosylmethionine--8-amino-7-oxononanoate transaminase [Citrobacter europaeus]AUT94417.1 adenosylmethionine--8-amino-7-oxononanoate transaminase [Citrobacter freundii]ROW36606.1 adenosylmethionine--8-amino-7-oxononanoate transaminase [Citrobacter europaeus]